MWTPQELKTLKKNVKDFLVVRAEFLGVGHDGVCRTEELKTQRILFLAWGTIRHVQSFFAI